MHSSWKYLVKSLSFSWARFKPGLIIYVTLSKQHNQGWISLKLGMRHKAQSVSKPGRKCNKLSTGHKATMPNQSKIVQKGWAQNRNIKRTAYISFMKSTLGQVIVLFFCGQKQKAEQSSAFTCNLTMFLIKSFKEINFRIHSCCQSGLVVNKI